MFWVRHDPVINLRYYGIPFVFRHTGRGWYNGKDVYIHLCDMSSDLPYVISIKHFKEAKAPLALEYPVYYSLDMFQRIEDHIQKVYGVLPSYTINTNLR